MNSSDPFRILGLHPGAPPDEVRRAYRKLAMRWHPDRNQHSKVSEDRFKHIKAAYEIASDEAAYRAWRDSRAASAQTSEAAADTGKRAAERDQAAAADAAASAATAPIEQTLTLSLEEAARGGRRTIRVDRPLACVPCAGSGRVDQDHSIACPKCHGIGRLRGKSLLSGEKCPGCGGRGYVRFVPCPSCQGRGSTVTQAVFEVLVPVGLRHGETLRLARAGGSVLLQIEHRPHPLFSLRGNDLHCDVPVDVLAFIAGGEIEVPTLDKLIRVALPAAALDTEFRLVDKGFPRRHGKGAGDLVLHLQAVFPKDLSPSETAQLRQLAAALASRAPELLDWKKRLAERKHK